MGADCGRIRQLGSAALRREFVPNDLNHYSFCSVPVKTKYSLRHFRRTPFRHIIFIFVVGVFLVLVGCKRSINYWT